MNDTHDARLMRAMLSLKGLSVGDGFGERFFLDLAPRFIEERRVPNGPWPWTDDTAMAISVVEVLANHGEVDQDWLAERFARRFNMQPGRGYGAGAYRILKDVAAGMNWRKPSRAVFGGSGSMGNGGAMRVGPLGAWFADDLDMTVRQAAASAEVTHANPDGQAGAIATAVAAAWAWRHRGDVDGARGLLRAAWERTPDGMTRDGLHKALNTPLSSSVRLAADKLGNGSRILSRDTVPFSLWCAARHIDDFVEAMWATVSALGDRDTTCAIVGGIVSLYVGAEGLPEDWVDAVEPLPDEVAVWG